MQYRRILFAVLFLSVSVYADEAAQQATDETVLEKAQNLYTRKLDQAEKDHLKALAGLNREYQERLVSLKDSFTEAGDQEAAAAIDREVDRFSRSNNRVTEADVVKEPLRLMLSQKWYLDAPQKAQQDLEAARSRITDDYLEFLDTLQERLVDLDKPGDLQLVADEIQRIKSSPSLGPSETSQAAAGVADAQHSEIQEKRASYYASRLASFRRGLVLYFPFDEDSPGRVIDKSTRGHQGTTQGRVQWTKTGKISGALEFSGSGEHILVPTFDPLREIGVRQGFTVCAWLNAKPNPGRQALIYYSEMFSILNEGDQKWRVSWGRDAVPTFSFRRSPVNRWSHLVFVGDTTSRTIKAYQDGNHVFTHYYKGQPVFGRGDFIIGRRGSGYSLEGYLDELRIYNRALSAAEVKQLHRLQDTP